MNSNYTYLLILRGRLSNVSHQHRHQFRYSANGSGIRAVLGRAVYGLTLSLCLFKPLAGYRVYDVEDPQFVRSWDFLEVCEEFLNENGFGLQGGHVSSQNGDARYHEFGDGSVRMSSLTWMLATQRDVRLVIRDPDTPGGFKLSMAWRPASKSATADAMVGGFGLKAISLAFLPRGSSALNVSARFSRRLVCTMEVPSATKTKGSKVKAVSDLLSLAGPVNHLA